MKQTLMTQANNFPYWGMHYYTETAFATVLMSTCPLTQGMSTYPLTQGKKCVYRYHRNFKLKYYTVAVSYDFSSKVTTTP